MPLITLMQTWPNFSPGGECCNWSACKDRKVAPIPGTELEFEGVHALVMQKLTAWGIVGDMKKGDLGWVHLSDMIEAVGISKPPVSAAGTLLRWLSANVAKYIITEQTV
jgi:hypothetical protein